MKTKRSEKKLTLNKITIAALNPIEMSVALAGGCPITASCDVQVCSENETKGASTALLC
jgi:enoyl-CoA hydratase/carnithine racemase